MARQRQPIEVAMAKGADKKDPGRFKDRQKTVKSDKPFGQAPPKMAEGLKSIWFELEAQAIGGVLTFADRAGFEAMVHLFYRLRTDSENFKASDFAQLRAYLGAFGMTPVDRAKLAMPPEKPVNEFDALDS